jgi:hypothetical protein
MNAKRRERSMISLWEQRGSLASAANFFGGTFHIHRLDQACHRTRICAEERLVEKVSTTRLAVDWVVRFAFGLPLAHHSSDDFDDGSVHVIFCD